MFSGYKSGNSISFLFFFCSLLPFFKIIFALRRTKTNEGMLTVVVNSRAVVHVGIVHLSVPVRGSG